MTVKLSIGKFDVIGGKKVVTGSTTELDTKAMIEASLEAKKTSVTSLEDSIKLNNEKSKALSELSGFTKKLKDSINKLKFIPGSSGLTTNAFSSRIVTLSSSSTVPANSYIAVDAKNGAPLSAFDIEVKQVAKSMIQQSRALISKIASITDDATTHTNGRFTAGTFQINGESITLSQGDNLVNIASKINAVNKQTKVTASIIEPTIGEFRLLLQSDETGLSKAYTITDASQVLNDLFTYDAVTHPNLNLQVAKDAIITYNGVLDVTRASNVISDFMENMTFSLFQETPGGTKIKIDVDPNATKVSEVILEFVNNYNALMKFSTQQQLRGKDGKLAESAKLGRDPVLSAISYNINSYVNQVVSGLTGYSRLSEIGINFIDIAEDKVNNEPAYFNILDIDADILPTALISKFGEVKKVFELDFYADSLNILLSNTRGNSITANSFTVDINRNRTTNDIVRVTYNDGSGPVTINAAFTAYDANDLTKGGTIIGITGTILEGWTFGYIGDGVETINVTMTQGIADKINNYLAQLESNETITKSQNLLDNINTRNEEDIKKMNRTIDLEKDALLLKFSQLEAIYAKANSILMYLDAQSGLMNKR